MILEGQVSPEDYASIPGKNVSFYCKSDEPVTWKFEDMNLPDNANQGYDNGIYWLEIAKVRYSNSGSYQCYGVINGIRFRSSAELMIVSTLFNSKFIAHGLFNLIR